MLKLYCDAFFDCFIYIYNLLFYCYVFLVKSAQICYLSLQLHINENIVYTVVSVVLSRFAVMFELLPNEMEEIGTKCENCG